MRALFVEYDQEFFDDLISDVKKDYVVDIAFSGIEGTFLSQVNDYDVLVIDSKLPDINVTQVCKITRDSQIHTPILIVTNGEEEYVRVENLNSGADAHIPKYSGSKELLAQMKALIRRNNFSKNLLVAGNVEFDTVSKSVMVEGKYVYLRRKEYDLLEYLMQNKNRVVTKEELLEHVWQEGVCVFSNTVEVHVLSLRKKFKNYSDKEIIETVRGFGYRIKV